MLHVVILFDEEGNPYAFSPPHNENGRLIGNALPSVIAFCDTDKLKIKDKEIRPQSEIPPHLLASLEAMLA